MRWLRFMVRNCKTCGHAGATRCKRSIVPVGNSVRQRLHLIRCPTFLLHGMKDPLVPTFHADVLKKGIVNSRLHMFPDGKHNIHLAYAQEFNKMLVDFLHEKKGGANGES